MTDFNDIMRMIQQIHEEDIQYENEYQRRLELEEKQREEEEKILQKDHDFQEDIKCLMNFPSRIKKEFQWDIEEKYYELYGIEIENRRITSFNLIYRNINDNEMKEICFPSKTKSIHLRSNKITMNGIKNFVFPKYINYFGIM